MPFLHDPNLYTTVPTRIPATCLSLCRALGVAARKPAPNPIKARIAKMFASAAALQAVWIAANRPAVSGEALRFYDLGLDRAWSATRSRTQDWVNVEDEDHAERAEALIELLFPTGLDFCNLPYAEQWAESERRLALIDKDGLEADIADLIDARFVTRLRHAHAQYGDALAITAKKEPGPDPIRISEAMKKLRADMAGYARLILGLTDEDDEKSVAQAEAELEPMLRYRKTRSSGTKSADESELGEGDVADPIIEPIEDPLPDLPPSE